MQEDAVVDSSGRIGIATDDLVRLIDSVERGKGRAREIIDDELLRRLEDDGVGQACTVNVTANHQILVVITEDDRGGRAIRIDRRMKGAVGILPETMADCVLIIIITAELVEAINLISQCRP